MFLSVILVCFVDGGCQFRSLHHPFSTRFECGLSLKEGVEFFSENTSIDYAEGRCIEWGQLIGDRS